MHRAARRIVLIVFLLFSVQITSLHAAPLFTHPPTDIEDVAGVVPLGNVSPMSHHWLPVDHMYLHYPIPNTGNNEYPVYSMAAGKIVMVNRRPSDHGPDAYQIYIRHNRYVTSYFDYIYEPSERIRTHLESTGAGWLELPGDSQSMFLGYKGAPAKLSVTAGEELGKTRNFHTSWDVGVIDSRVSGSFLGRGKRRYPRIGDYLVTLGYGDIPNPYRGHQTLNTASFIKYMTPALKTAWFALLVSEPKQHGRAGWDLRGKLRGSWFSEAVDTTEPAPLWDLEYGVVSITPYNLAPATKVQIAIAQGNSLSALDPQGEFPQLARATIVDMDKTPGARVNPNPARVSQKTGTVCYDVTYDDGGTTRFSSLLFRMTGQRRVAIRFDATLHDISDCANRISHEPDDTWMVYRR